MWRQRRAGIGAALNRHAEALVVAGVFALPALRVLHLPTAHVHAPSGAPPCALPSVQASRTLPPPSSSFTSTWGQEEPVAKAALANWHVVVAAGQRLRCSEFPSGMLLRHARACERAIEKNEGLFQLVKVGGVVIWSTVKEVQPR